MFPLDIGELFVHPPEHPLPEAVGVNQRGVFIRHRHLRVAVRAGILEGVAANSLDPLIGIHVLLNGHLVGRPLFEVASHPDINALGVLADHDKIDGHFLFERTKPAVEQGRGPKIHKKIEFPAKPHEQIPAIDARRNPRIVARAPEEDRIVLLGHIAHQGRHILGKR